MTQALAPLSVRRGPAALEFDVGRVLDPLGHHWEIGKPVIPWPPETITAKR